MSKAIGMIEFKTTATGVTAADAMVKTSDVEIVEAQTVCPGKYIAIITGVEKYTGARVSAPDLRAGAALVIAGLAAEGITIVDDIYYIERGYEHFEEKLASLGAMIEKVSSEKEIQKFTLKVS